MENVYAVATLSYGTSQPLHAVALPRKESCKELDPRAYGKGWYLVLTVAIISHALTKLHSFNRALQRASQKEET